MINTTIIISNFNYARYLASAVDSSLGQTVSCEIIVVDDASTDDSWNILQQYKDHPRVILVRLKENSGGNARGKNVGICLTKTEFVTCLDSDDMLLPDSIEKRMNFGDADFVHGWTHYSKTHETYESIKLNRKFANKKFKRNRKQIELFEQSKTNPARWTWAIHGNTVLAKTDLYDRFGLYDEVMNWKVAREMWWRWLSHGVKCRTVDEFVAIYRKHGQNVTIFASKNKGPKNSALVTSLLKRRQKEREKITKENTLLLNHYDFAAHIEEINVQ